jgi:uncharacterized protein (TIGR02466 family)
MAAMPACTFLSLLMKSTNNNFNLIRLFAALQVAIVHSAGYAKLYKYGIGNSWVNVHNENGQTTPHNHPDALFVAATYLQMPKDGGFFECKDPLEYHKCLNNHETPDWMWKEIPTVTGDVLIFPAWLQHRTQKNLSGQNRWVLTTNFYGMPVLPESYFR